ncbi:hypothetical protein [Caulobacter vibrioides]|nr:hypothetical protein [Caulobacter vibrioides]
MQKSSLRQIYSRTGSSSFQAHTLPADLTTTLANRSRTEACLIAALLKVGDESVLAL